MSMSLRILVVAATAIVAASGARAQTVRALDTALAERVLHPSEGDGTALAIVEAQARRIDEPGAAEALQARAVIARALDQLTLARRAGGGATPQSANTLVDLLRFLGSLAETEATSKRNQPARPNDLAGLRKAVWQMHAAALERWTEAAGHEPLAPRREGRLFGQWTVATSRPTSVKVLDLWGRADHLDLAWSSATFAEPAPQLDQMLKRGRAVDDHVGARLALYVDLAAFSSAERARFKEAAQAWAASTVQIVLDDTAARRAACVEERLAPKAKAPRSEAPTPPSRPLADGAPAREAPTEDGSAAGGEAPPLRAGLTPVPPAAEAAALVPIEVKGGGAGDRDRDRDLDRSAPIDDGGAEAAATARAGIEERCRASVAAGAKWGDVLLVDIGRRLRITGFDGGDRRPSADRILARTTAIARVWP